MPKRRIADLMNPNIVCARPDLTVAEAQQLFARRGITGAPVLDGGGNMVGVVTLNDLTRFLAESLTVSDTGKFVSDVEEYADLGGVADDRTDTPIEKLMTRKVVSVGPEDSVAHAANVMRERRIHRLMVVTGPTLVGVVTTFDLLRVVEEAC